MKFPFVSEWKFQAGSETFGSETFGLQFVDIFEKRSYTV
jgi:hypothetical protein